MTLHSEAQSSTVSRFAPYAVYTILHPRALKDIAENNQAAPLREKKRWVRGGLLFNEARRQGQEMVIVFADATRCSKLLFWGRLTALDVNSDGTRYAVAGLTSLSGKKTQGLVLRSTNAYIAEGFIRPYAIVQTPSYIDKHADRHRVGNGRIIGARADTGILQRNIGAPHSGATTLFSFGYWGCGSATKDLVKGVNAAEALRGFEPPLWVDIRISRAVRAAGFRDGEFAHLLDSSYVWMPELGNKRVHDRGRGIEIQDPAAAADLLKLALYSPARRVIFFCACEHPANCHRKQVGKLILNYAKKLRARVQVIEWPGGEPDTLTIDVVPAILRKIERNAAKRLSIPSSMTVGEATSLPWGTIATVQAGRERVKVLIGPAYFNAAGSHLRVFPDEPATRANAKSFRMELGYSQLG
jgi:hypothetical protein